MNAAVIPIVISNQNLSNEKNDNDNNLLLGI